MSDIVDLLKERLRRNHDAGHAAHEAGTAFQFTPYEPGPESEDLDVGWIEAPLPICLLVSREELRGLCMSRETAARLGAVLLEISAAEKPSEEDS